MSSPGAVSTISELLSHSTALTMASNVSFASPVANAFAQYRSVNLPPQIDYVIDKIANASLSSVLVTLLAICVVYDQC